MQPHKMVDGRVIVNGSLWTYSINDTDGDGEVQSTSKFATCEEAHEAAYRDMCNVFDGPEPDVIEAGDDKQYVPKPTWIGDDNGDFWDVYGDRTFIVYVFKVQS